MEPRHINRFFTLLDQQLKQPVTVILTGAAAGSLLGHVRPSQDIDFAVRPASGSRWDDVERAILATSRLTNIQVNYAADIDRWSSITLLDYGRHTRLHRRFGAIEVRVLDPVYWSIGKLARGLDADLHDVVMVFRKQRPAPKSVLGVWARALRRSPRSPALSTFRQRVDGFLRARGGAIWGSRFDAEAAVAEFHRLSSRRDT